MRMILSNPAADLEEYRRIVDAAARAGVMYVTISQPPAKSRWELDDPSDPYLQWSIVHLSLFKVIVPEVLADWVPAEWAARTLQTLKERCRIVAAAGLRPALLCYEPMWWPQRIFEANPHLRGPRVDHPRRSRHPRFSPDLAHPQVLAMYRSAVAELLRQLPELRLAILSTNDSGCGISWAEGLYNHANGPTAGRGMPIGRRIAEFLDAWAQGAADAGVDEFDCRLRGRLLPLELESVRLHARRPDGSLPLAFFGPNPQPEPAVSALPATYVYPVKDIGQPLELMRGLCRESRRENVAVILNPLAEAFITEWSGSAIDLEVLLQFHQRQPRTPLQRHQALAAAMEAVFGAELAPVMHEAYEHLDEAMGALRLIDAGGSLLLNWLVGQRWITRPMAPFPERLSAGEKAHFRPFLFQAQDEARADNPLDAQGTQLFHGVAEARTLAARLFQAIQSNLRQALALLRPHAAWPEVRRLAERIEVLGCLIATCQHFISFYTTIAHLRRALGEPPADGVPAGEPSWRNDGDREARTLLYDLMRAEIDNTEQLIAHLAAASEPPLVLAGSSEEEDVFTLGPDLAGQLRTKVRLMWAHFADLDGWLRRPNL